MTTARRRLFFANGVFLVVVGGVQVVFELLAYYAGVGPYGYIFDESPYAIGWVEAHGLAFIIGVLLLTVAVRTSEDPAAGDRLQGGFFAAHSDEAARQLSTAYELVDGVRAEVTVRSLRQGQPQTQSVQSC